MLKKNLILSIIGVTLLVVAGSVASYFFFASKNELTTNNSLVNQIVDQIKTTLDDEGKGPTETGLWRQAANLANVNFENLDQEKTYNYNNETINFSSGWMINPTTGDKQSVRIYSAIDDGDGLPLVVLVSGGVNDGTEFEKDKGGVTNAVKLAAEGFVVIVYSPLGLGESEGEMNFQGFDDQDGLAAIVAAGKKLDGVDTGKIGLASFSYGVTGATGVLARYPDLGIKFYSDWEGPSSRSFTSPGCTVNSEKIERTAPGSFSCADDAHWAEREAVKFIPEAHIQYYWRIQQEQDHVQPTYGHTLEMMQGAVGAIPWVKLNDGLVNPQYKTEADLNIVPNEKDVFSAYVIPHLKELAETES